MKNKDKINLSCFMMGGFEIVDYSDSINQLHRKLLTKILLNKWIVINDNNIIITLMIFYKTHNCILFLNRT